MTTVFSENLKKFRQNKNLTQEEAANALGVSTQSISRWECSSALPDVLRLPEIARLYGVSVDDFYKKTSSSYENYAQRMAAVYSQTRKPCDFIIADNEFNKRIENGEYSLEDMLFHAHIHQSMMIYCNGNAVSLFDKIIGANKKDRTYWKARQHKNNHRMFIGETDECIKDQEKAFEASGNSIDEFYTLILTYYLAGRYEEGYECYIKNANKFDLRADILIVAGNLAQALGKYDEAAEHYEKAKELDPCSSRLYYAMARSYEMTGEYEKAVEAFSNAARLFEKDGYDIEAQKAEFLAKEAGFKVN